MEEASTDVKQRTRPERWAALLLLCCFLTACSLPGHVKPTVKIGLSAPFEGLYRDSGYEALHAVRLAVRQRNQSGGIAGRYLVELVALNDFCEPGEAVIQAGKMAVDAGVLGVLGGCSYEAVVAAAPEYQRAGLTFVFPAVHWTEMTPSTRAAGVPGFAAEYQELSGGVPPGPLAVWAYHEANRLLDALDGAAAMEGHPTRAGVRQAMASHE
jgi:ABC-type branched-subunit amino acid transport system substrate-binding protein